MCVDYEDWQRKPEDDFPIPHIDILMDATPDHALFSFRRFLRLQLNSDSLEDQEKTSFITPWRIFCY